MYCADERSKHELILVNIRHRTRLFFLGLLASAAVFGIALIVQSGAVLAEDEGAPAAEEAPATDFGFSAVEESGLQLGTTDIRVTITRIIRAVLGFLGLIALIVVLYAGFRILTAGGNEDTIRDARKILINGAIGLAIILMSVAIVQFVLQRLTSATGADFFGGRDRARGILGFCDIASPDFDPARCQAACEADPTLSMCLDQRFFVKS